MFVMLFSIFSYYLECYLLFRLHNNDWSAPASTVLSAVGPLVLQIIKLFVVGRQCYPCVYLFHTIKFRSLNYKTTSFISYI